ncbi:tRNA (adenosine(37)-N6)-threonylcarbamoyltransferase complex ATPase subunit type 1 TsaE [Candidatus Peregrinibacteria bacterium CG10_big_fil_rev_8_21_14_0_10_36_19]|nr:MAG: tRNA (adenosine(37)-N6)-threonylcarbamoyltransferase complex ATPase subunit type 1 TsaE [Candidatus Peregrinibacteria bacterium CG10_big_fil_rev_8_21_14_0_10_36_19]
MKKLTSIKETQSIANKLAQDVKNGGVILLFGNLGSGKTTLTKFIAEEFNISQFLIKSPTYNYIRKYNDNFYHLDLYRIEEMDEIMIQEISEIWEDDKNVVIIEWSERLGDNLPSKYIAVTMEFIDEESRGITIEYAN